MLVFLLQALGICFVFSLILTGKKTRLSFKIDVMDSLQYITDKAGKKTSVIVPIDEYKKMIEALEELDDVRLYDEAKQDTNGSIPFDEYLKQRNARQHG